MAMAMVMASGMAKNSTKSSDLERASLWIPSDLEREMLGQWGCAFGKKTVEPELYSARRLRLVRGVASEVVLGRVMVKTLWRSSTPEKEIREWWAYEIGRRKGEPEPFGEHPLQLEIAMERVTARMR